MAAAYAIRGTSGGLPADRQAGRRLPLLRACVSARSGQTRQGPSATRLRTAGIVGLKPTYGLVSTTGVVPLSWSLDHVGPMTRTVRDAALMLQVIAGFD